MGAESFVLKNVFVVVAFYVVFPLKDVVSLM